jgi:hypothetical protein
MVALPFSGFGDDGAWGGDFAQAHLIDQLIAPDQIPVENGFFRSEVLETAQIAIQKLRTLTGQAVDGPVVVALGFHHSMLFQIC